jgi:CheY-like chemotaxis protein
MSTANAERVLIADDDPNLLDAYLLFFEGQGYEVRTASDGVEALGQYWAWLPAIVILDIQMPRLDGWTVAKEIRRLTDSAAPLLLAVTGLSTPSERAESIRCGFAHHFIKPAPLPDILAAIVSRPS